MIYRSYNPPPPLADLVERFWLCSDAPSHLRESILPSGTFELVINLHEDEIRIYDPLQRDCCKRFSGAVVSGPYGRCFSIDPQQHASMIGVHFRPGGAFPFLGAPATDFANAHIDLETLWGSSAIELRERLYESVTHAERFSVLEQSLLARLHRTPGPHYAVSIALAAFAQRGPAARVADVARHIGLSQRRFILVFATEVGVTPKLYSRLNRFQMVRQRVQKAEMADWARVAVTCGYFDQSHLIRDFQEFSGLSPGEYLRRSSEPVLPNHVPRQG